MSVARVLETFLDEDEASVVMSFLAPGDNVDEYFVKCCESGYFDGVVIGFNSASPEDREFGFLTACQEGFRSIIDWMIARGVRCWDAGLEGACYGGNIEIADFMLSKGASNLLEAFGGACHSGSLRMIGFMIRKGAPWEEGASFYLYDACESGNVAVVEFLIGIKGERTTGDWNAALCGAAAGGNMDIVDLIISMGADGWNNGLYGACEGGHAEIVSFMIEKGANNWNSGLTAACRRGRRSIARLMITKGATECEARLCHKSLSAHLEGIEE